MAETKVFTERMPPTQFKVLQEKVENNNWMLVEGLFQRADVKNGNGRIYPMALWEHVMQDPEVKRRLEMNGMTGVVEHPESGQTHLMEVSHVIKKLWMEGKDVKMQALVLDTVPGVHIQKLFRAGIPVGISSRGRGTSFTRDGCEYVEASDFKLDTGDFVSTPSVEGAYPRIAESLEGPYKTESSMDAKTAEVMRLSVRAHEIKDALTGADTKSLDKFVTELIEAESKVNTLLSQKPELKDDASKALTVIKEARSQATGERDKKYDETAAAFTQKVAAVVTPQTAVKEQALASNDLLSETFARLQIADSRIKELEKQVLEKKDSVPLGKFESAKKLAAALVAAGRASEKTLASTKTEMEKVKKAYASAFNLLETFISRNDEAKFMRRIREACSDNPQLQKVEAILRKCKTLAELDETIDIQAKAFGVVTDAAPEVAPKTQLHKIACSACKYVTEAEVDAGEVMCPHCGKQTLAPAAQAPAAPVTKTDEPAPHKPAFESALPKGPVDKKKPPVKSSDPKAYLTERTGDAEVDFTRMVITKLGGK